MVQYAPLVRADLADALQLWAQCDGLGLSSADTSRALSRYLERNPGLSYCARSGKKLVGAVLCGHDGRRGYLHHLAVAPGHRHQGIARELLELCWSQLRLEGIEKAHVFVLRSNVSGLEFWRHLGWTHRVDLEVLSLSGAGA